MSQSLTRERLVGWVCVNGIAAWLCGSVICRQSPELAAWSFGLAVGLLQSAAIGRTLREALAWAVLTAISVPVAGLLAVIPLLLVAYANADRSWIVGALLGVAVGAGVGVAQGAVFHMRHAPGRVIGIWTLANSVSAAVVGALALAVVPSRCGPQDATGAALGAAFGLLTALPLATVLRAVSSGRR